MMPPLDIPRQDAPVAIGGIGGSGTRLLAEILARLGFYMGGDLNESNDNLWFTLLFKRTELLDGDLSAREFENALDLFLRAMRGTPGLSLDEERWIFILAQKDRPQHTASWLYERAVALTNALQTTRAFHPQWGWKEPNTHIFLDRLQRVLPELKYIHMMRNGLDMAHSTNQNQPQLWGEFFVKTLPWEASPRYSLKYWRVMQERARQLGKNMDDRFLLLNYDDFCKSPQNGLTELLEFLGIDVSMTEQQALAALVHPPASIGRFKNYGLELFDPSDVAYVRSLGFDTAPA